MKRRHFISNSLLSIPVIAGSLPAVNEGLRVLFVTDMHLSPSIEVSVKAAAYLKNYINTNTIDFVINGGDSVYDVAKHIAPEGEEMWKMAATFFEGLNKPVYHCIGNHDIYEWERTARINDPQQRKETVLKRLQMPGRYYAFKKGRWKFIVLDSVMYQSLGYKGALDEEQFQWLADELQKDKDQHTCIISHIPILTACDVLYLPWERHAVFPKIAERLSHDDASRIFAETEKTKIAAFLHGHLHMQESIQYKDTVIHTHTAFCGDMWKGDFHGFKPGFTMIDFKDNGKINSVNITLPETLK